MMKTSSCQVPGSALANEPSGLETDSEGDIFSACKRKISPKKFSGRVSRARKSSANGRAFSMLARRLVERQSLPRKSKNYSVVNKVPFAMIETRS
jgi:hypothetical protein